MPNKNPTDGQSVPTQKPAFFVLNEATPLTDLLWEAQVLADRAKGLIESATGGEEYGLNSHMIMSILNGARTAVEQIDAILSRFADVQHRSEKITQGQKVRPFSDDERARFLEKLQQRSDLTLKISGAFNEDKAVRANQRNLMLEGMVELFDLLNEVGIAIPSDVAQIVESEMGRAGQ